MVTDGSEEAALEQEGRDPAVQGVWERLADRAHDYPQDRVVHCGWGRVLFAQTFAKPEHLLEILAEEAAGERDIVFYVHEPHVLTGIAPHAVFLDPSHTYRADLSETTREYPSVPGIRIEKAAGRADLRAIDAILRQRGMVPIDVERLLDGRGSDGVTWFLARRVSDLQPLGATMGIDHSVAFGDPERGSSLWSLAVDPGADRPGIGRALVEYLLAHYAERGARYLDLSVTHDNTSAIALYESIGFRQVPVFCVKRKNPVNEPLFTPDALPALNPYAEIVIREARRRGILVEVLDQEAAIFRLSFGGRSVTCRESLSEMTSAVAMTRCMDKCLTWRTLTREGVSMPEQLVGGDAAERRAFLEKHGRVVVKPIFGEQGQGVSVGLETVEEVEAAVAALQRQGADVLVEEMVDGEELRTIVINGELVAAALRLPARIVGNGKRTVRELIERQSRRRAAATAGESRIPLDAETERMVRRAGYSLDSVPPADTELVVRSTANLHTGGTMQDVTDVLHPRLAEESVRIASILEIPVVGLDLIVEHHEHPTYKLIEANERPGLANHEPQPTAERFVDLLFPATVPVTD